VVKTCEIEKAILKIGSVTCTAESTGIIVECGNTTVDIGTIIKIGTAGESLFGILNDLLIAMTLMTVTTSTGPSSVPINLASFNALQTRLGNLLSA
jgi:coenzyme F420-reducing hydrogenase gamma subunit